MLLKSSFGVAMQAKRGGGAILMGKGVGSHYVILLY